MLNTHAPQALFFEYNATGIPVLISTCDKRPFHKINGFWATVIKVFPDDKMLAADPRPYSRRVWLLKKEENHYMVMCADTHHCDPLSAVVLFSGVHACEEYFDMVTNKYVLRHLIAELIVDARFDHEPVTPGGHIRRAKSIIRDDLMKCQDESVLGEIAALLGTSLSRERLAPKQKRKQKDESSGGVLMFK